MNRSHTRTSEDRPPESDATLRLLFVSSPDALILANDDGRFLDANAFACVLLGRTHKRLLKMRVADLLAPEPAGAGEQYRRYLRSGRETGELTFVRPDRESRTVSFSACRLDAGRHLGVLRDVTAQRREEEGRRAADRQYRHLFEFNPQPMWVFDADSYRFLAVNAAAVSHYGYSADEFAGMTVHDLRPPEDLPLHVDQLANRPVSLTETAIWRHYKKDGALIHVELARQFVQFEGRPAVFVLVNDITEEHRRKEEVEALNRRLTRAMTETHHRVKNNLQLISALVDLQVEAGQETVPAAALVRIGQHARALAALHDLLTNESRANMRADILSTRAAMDKLIPLLQVGIVGRVIRHEVADIYLPVRDSAALALLVAELVSNAIKHGRGDIEIAVRADKEYASLIVGDDGPGFPAGFDWRAAANTGLGLIESTGRYDLRGTISYENGPNGGGRVSIVFPVPALHPD